MENIRKCIKKTEKFIYHNKNTIALVNNKHFYYCLKKLLKKIIKNEYNFKFLKLLTSSIQN